MMQDVVRVSKRPGVRHPIPRRKRCCAPGDPSGEVRPPSDGNPLGAPTSIVLAAEEALPRPSRRPMGSVRPIDRAAVIFTEMTSGASPGSGTTAQDGGDTTPEPEAQARLGAVGPAG